MSVAVTESAQPVDAWPRPLRPLVRMYFKTKTRLEPIVRDFEWTWTTAVIFSLVFSFVCVITMAVIPSFWLYFAEQELGWDGLSGTSDWQPLARDFIAVNLSMQNWRRKLRGGSADRPTGGYR